MSYFCNIFAILLHKWYIIGPNGLTDAHPDVHMHMHMNVHMNGVNHHGAEDMPPEASSLHRPGAHGRPDPYNPSK